KGGEAPIIAGGFEQRGAVRALALNQRGIIYFPLPYSVAPRVTIDSYFVVTEVTTTYFKWRHTDPTPSNSTSRAPGPRSANAPDEPFVQQGNVGAVRLRQQGLTRFPSPYARPPNVEIDNSFLVTEVTSTYFRWQFTDNSPTNSTWTARGVRP